MSPSVSLPVTPHPTTRVAQLGDLRSSPARQAQLLLQQNKQEVGSECGPGSRGVPTCRTPLLPPTPTHLAAPPLPHLAVTARSIPTTVQGEGDKPPIPGQHKGTSSSVPKAGGLVARPRSDGRRVVQWEQHPCAQLEHGPRMVASPCPPSRPPHPRSGKQPAAPTLFIFPASGNISRENCLLTGGAAGQRAAGDRNSG